MGRGGARRLGALLSRGAVFWGAAACRPSCARRRAPVMLLVVPQPLDEVALGARHGQTAQLQLLFEFGNLEESDRPSGPFLG